MILKSDIIQWNLSIVGHPWDHINCLDQIGVFISEVVFTLLYVGGTVDSVLIREVFLFQRSIIGRFHYIHVNVHAVHYFV